MCHHTATAVSSKVDNPLGQLTNCLPRAPLPARIRSKAMGREGGGLLVPIGDAVSRIMDVRGDSGDNYGHSRFENVE